MRPPVPLRAAAARAALCAAPLVTACVVTPLSVARRQDAMRVAPRAVPNAGAPGARPTTAAARPAPFAWPGTYDLVAHDFPDGDRHATLTVTGRDGRYALAIDGPPGWAAESRVDGDSAHVVWEFGGGAAPMFVWLRGRADSLAGEWAAGPRLGPVRGSRRRGG